MADKLPLTKAEARLVYQAAAGVRVPREDTLGLEYANKDAQVLAAREIEAGARAGSLKIDDLAVVDGWLAELERRSQSLDNVEAIAALRRALAKAHMAGRAAHWGH